MAIKDITEKIITEAELKAESILLEGKKEVAVIEKQTEEELEVQEAEQAKRLNAQVDEIKTQKRVLTTMTSKNNTLNQKREILKDVMAETEKLLNNLKEKEYVEFLTRLFVQAEKDGVVGDVVGAKGREKETKKALADFKNLKLAKEVGKFAGGVVIKTSEGAIIDFTTANLVNEVYSDDIELYTAKHLFD